MRILLLAGEPGADRGGGAGRHRGLPTNRTVDAVEHLVAARALHDVACRPGPDHPHGRACETAGGEAHAPRLRRRAPCLGRDINTTDLRFPVQYVIRPNLDFRGFAGTLASGVLRKGDRVTVLPSGRGSRVK